MAKVGVESELVTRHEKNSKYSTVVGSRQRNMKRRKTSCGRERTLVDSRGEQKKKKRIISERSRRPVLSSEPALNRNR